MGGYSGGASFLQGGASGGASSGASSAGASALQGAANGASSGGAKKSSSGNRFKKPAASSGAIVEQFGEAASRNADRMGGSVGKVEYHRGGKVRKTGPAIVKRGESVIPAGKRKKVERLMKRKGMKLTNKKRSKSRSSGR